MGFFDKIFKSKRDKAALPPEVRKFFDRALRLMNDDEAQNQIFIHPTIKNRILSGQPCDKVPYPKGEFGRDPRNPIPVNGFMGEITYLSRLRSRDAKANVIFHRLRSIKAPIGIDLDIYETVTFDAETWDILIFDMYHPVKSRLAPEGYVFADRVEGLTGTNKKTDNFPFSLEAASSRNMLPYIPAMSFRDKPINWTMMKRPAPHQKLVDRFEALRDGLEERAESSPLVNRNASGCRADGESVFYQEPLRPGGRPRGALRLTQDGKYNFEFGSDSDASTAIYLNEIILVLESMNSLRSDKVIPAMRTKTEGDISILIEWASEGRLTDWRAFDNLLIADYQAYQSIIAGMAKGFVAYMAEGVSPAQDMTETFQSMAQLLRELYPDPQGYLGGRALTDKVRAVYANRLNA